MLSGPGTTIFSGRHVGKPNRRKRRKSAPRAGNQHLAVAHQQPRLQPDGALEGRHHREVEFVVEHHLGEQVAVAFDDVQAHFRAARHEIVEHRRQHRAGEGRHQADAQFAGDFAGERARLLGGVLERADRLHAALVVAKAGRRRLHAAGGALEQLDAERALDRRDVLGDARLGGVLALAARVKEPSSQTAMTARTCRRGMSRMAVDPY